LRTIVGAGSTLLPVLATGAVLLALVLQGVLSAPLGNTAVACGAVAIALGAGLRRWVLRQLDSLLSAQAAESLRFDTAINKISQGLCFFDGQQRLIFCNQRYAEMYQLSRDLMRPGTTLREIVDHRFAAGSFPDMTTAEYLAWRVSISVAAKASDTVLTLKNGRVIAIHHQPMPDGGWVATHEDITERRCSEAQIERMARCDALTGLANRVQFRERLGALEGSGSTDESTAVLLIDLDRFKAVNDTLGHPVGDELLRATALRLRACVRPNDLVARLGGDEFAIVQSHAPQPAAARSLAERLVQELSAPFEIDDHQVVVGASVGVSLPRVEGSDPDELLKEADLALYDAKAAGRGRHSFFRSQMMEQADGRRSLEIDLRQAESKCELELHYQPIVNMASRRVVCLEALLRWRHPTRGLVMPDSFIPLAEETGLIEALGAWALREAFTQACGWPAHIAVAVNLSPVQFRSGKLTRIMSAALHASGIAPERVELEITESVRLAESSSNLAILHDLRAQGVRISLDDFGVGYSSLSYLRSFPFETIKIDRSFVREVCTSPDAAAIVGAIATLGKRLDMTVTAEGVEHAEQLNLLRTLGCTQAQGHLLSTPRPASEMDALLRRASGLPGLGRSAFGALTTT
jgi:diguanylate cyclase (GGDEF)-like protein